MFGFIRRYVRPNNPKPARRRPRALRMERLDSREMLSGSPWTPTPVPYVGPYSPQVYSNLASLSNPFSNNTMRVQPYRPAPVYNGPQFVQGPASFGPQPINPTRPLSTLEKGLISAFGMPYVYAASLAPVPTATMLGKAVNVLQGALPGLPTNMYQVAGSLASNWNSVVNYASGLMHNYLPQYSSSASTAPKSGSAYYPSSNYSTYVGGYNSPSSSYSTMPQFNNAIDMGTWMTNYAHQYGAGY